MEPVRLRPVVLGLGAVDGYTGSDLTNARDAVLAGEVPYAPQSDAQPDTTPVLEMRIHGVGGAPPETNLQSPSVVEVAGDDTAGFYRAWFPGGRATGQRLREAYSWGGLNTRSTLRALYLILVAFMLVNVSYWALPPADRPAKRGAPDGPRTRRLAAGRVGREPLGAVSRMLVRLLGLALTVEFFATALTILVDLVAWQAPQRTTGSTGTVSTNGASTNGASTNGASTNGASTNGASTNGASTGGLPSWLGWFARAHPGTRLAAALLVVLALLGVLMAASILTARSYEQKDTESYADYDPSSPMTHRGFWRGGRRTVNRQRNAHVLAVAGLVVFYAGLPAMAHAWLRDCYFGVAAVCGAVAVVLTVSPWCERDLNDVGHVHLKTSDRALMWGARLAVVLAIAGAGARQWLVVHENRPTFPGDGRTQETIVYCVFGIVLVLLVSVALQQPWRRTGLLAAGLASPLIAALGATVATIFGGSLTLAVANVLGTPKATTTADTATGHVLLMPSTVYAGSLGIVVALTVAVVIGLGAALWLRVTSRKLARDDGPDPLESVSYAYAEQGPIEKSDQRPATEHAAELRASSPDAIREVAKSWAQARLTDHAGLLLSVLVIPTALTLVSYLGVLQSGHSWWLFQLLATFGGLVGAAAIVVFLAFFRAALTNKSKRQRFGFFWDVGTFWPRACQPFAPPSYAERAVPEVATRLRRIVGDHHRGPHDSAAAEQLAEQAWMFGAGDTVPIEQHCRVLLTGYSQGAPISFAVLAQLPAAVTDEMALLTLNAPVRRLYGQAFPAYFGEEQRALLQTRLGDGRWMNMVRYTDYIGGWMFDPAAPRADLTDRSRIDQPVMDPPVLWPRLDLAAPPIHRHSDVFADPQLDRAAAELIDRLGPVSS